MILVTGGTGLVGAHLLYRLMADGENVRALYRSEQSLQITKEIFNTYPKPELFDQLNWVQGDILDTEFLISCIKDVEEVYHCAAVVSFNPADEDALMKVNIEGTANVVNACLAKNIRKLCYVSSIGAFGRAKRNEMVNENTHWENDLKPSNYSVSKYHAEMEVWRGIEEGLNAVIVNPSTVLGSGNWHRGSSAIFTKVWNGLPFYTAGINGYVDVLDVIEIMTRLMKSDINKERFLIVGENLPYQKFLTQIAKALGKRAPRYLIGRKLALLAAFKEKIQSILTGSKPLITRETVNVALDKQHYSNEKVKQALNHSFIPIQESIDRISIDFKAQFSR